MNRFFLLSALLLLFLAAVAVPLQGNVSHQERGQLPSIPGLADRLVTDRYIRGDALGVIRWTSENEHTG
ncbi:hypothetical protein EP232_02285, partial [bacterium]